MLGRLGNVIYWFCLLLCAGSFCIFVYQFVFNHVTQDEYKQYLTWGNSTWDAYLKRETESRHQIGFWCFVAGIVIAAIGKAFQYIFGGKWKLRDLEGNYREWLSKIN